MALMNADFMKRAIALSKKNVESGDGGPFGALLPLASLKNSDKYRHQALDSCR